MTVKEKNGGLKGNTGATTIIVICVMAIIMALSLGLFLSASVLVNTSGRTLANEQCRVLAVTFSEEVEAMLTSTDYNYQSSIEESEGRAQNLGSAPLWHYVKENISDGSWPFYEEGIGLYHGKESASRTFQMSGGGVAGEIADMELTLYWTRRGKDNNLPATLVVETTATVKEQSCTITDVYRLAQNGEGSYEAWRWEHVEKR